MSEQSNNSAPSQASRWGQSPMTFETDMFGEYADEPAETSPSSSSPSGLLLNDVTLEQVRDWRKISDVEQASIIVKMADWIDWMIQTFMLKPSVIPPCWYEHSDVVQEIYALWRIYLAGYAETDSGSGPLTFLERFYGAQMRLRDLIKETQCTKNAHVPVDTPVYRTDRTSQAWQRLLTDLDLPATTTETAS